MRSLSMKTLEMVSFRQAFHARVLPLRNEKNYTKAVWRHQASTLDARFNAAEQFETGKIRKSGREAKK